MAVNEFSKRLKELRGALSQFSFSQTLGISQRSLSRYELGVSAPDVETLCTICLVLNIDPKWLLFGKGPKELNVESEKAARAQDQTLSTRALVEPDVSCGKVDIQLWAFHQELRLERSTNRELSRELRAVYGENRQLWKENALLREKIARLEGLEDGRTP